LSCAQLRDHHLIFVMVRRRLNRNSLHRSACQQNKGNNTSHAGTSREDLDIVTLPPKQLLVDIGRQSTTSFTNASIDSGLRSDACSSSSTGSLCANSYEAMDSPTCAITLPFAEQQTNFSVGSKLHTVGGCKPCAWYWKPYGCKNADACGYCHLCPPGEVKNRKRSKIAVLKKGPVRVKECEQAMQLNSFNSNPECVRSMSESERFCAEHGHTRNVSMEERAHSELPEDQTMSEIQQRVTIKNTFIHVEFYESPEPSVVIDFVLPAGIIFAASGLA